MVAGRIWSRRASRALLDAESVPLPASGRDLAARRPPATAAAVTGLWITPPAEALAWSAVTAARILGPERSPPVTTTSAGDGRPRKARWIWSRARATGSLVGRSIDGLPVRMPSAGEARASRATAAA